MNLTNINSAQDLEDKLRNLNNWNDDEFTYDFNFIVSLLLALLDNLQKNSLEAELNDVGHSFNDAQRHFISILSQYANQLSDSDIED